MDEKYKELEKICKKLQTDIERIELYVKLNWALTIVIMLLLTLSEWI